MIRLLMAAAIAFTTSLAGTRILITVLTRRHVGQPIREDGPQGHVTKAGTPTMGGIAIVGALVVAYVLSSIVLKFTDRPSVFTYSGILVVLAVVGAGLVGFVDDWLKVTRARNLGLTKRAKIVGLLVVAFGFPLAMVNLTAQHTTLSWVRFDMPGWDLGTVGWVLVAALLILATTNAVNLTDGLDGLAGGASVASFAAFVVIGFWAFRYGPDYVADNIYNVPHALDLAVVAAALAAACLGFLWWNAAPARIFMGDTGSLAIGAGLASLALALNTQLLLVVIGGLFVMETVSVILQIGTFKLFGGRRLFRMAPMHHHFELGGWPETTVIIRLWIVAGVCTALGLGAFYFDFLRVSGV
jgi:phospho-N-acetylmuramoyl-pentapeptide-transferase